jgi:plastocyanin
MSVVRYAMVFLLGIVLIAAQDSQVRGDWCIGPDGYVYQYPSAYYSGPVYVDRGAYQAARPADAPAAPGDQTRRYAYRPVQEARGKTVVQITDRARFEPAHVTVDVGQTVEWRSAARHEHTVTANPELAANAAHVVLPEGAEPFHSGEIAPGSRYSYTFTVPGIYYYVCLPHEEMGMVGIVVVRSSPDAARRPPAPPQDTATAPQAPQADRRSSSGSGTPGY